MSEPMRPITEAEMFDRAGRGAARVMAMRNPSRGALEPSPDEVYAMALLIDCLGLARPELMAPRTPKTKEI